MSRRNKVLSNKTNSSSTISNISKSSSGSVINKVSDFLTNFCTFSESVKHNTSNSDDDPFEDIALSKNITFSRSRVYFDNEFPLYPVTPIRPKLNSEEKENQSLSYMQSSKDGLQKSLILRKNSPRTTPRRKILKDPTANEPAKTQTPDLMCDSTEKSKTSPVKIVTTKSLDLESMRNFEIGLNVSSNLGATSTPSNSSNDFSKNAHQSFTKNLSTASSSPLNSYENVCTPKTKNAPQVSSMKKYSLMKAAISAKKDFENMVRNVNLQKSGGKCDTNNLNMTLEVEQSIHPDSLLNTPNTSLGSLKSIQERRLSKTPLPIREGTDSGIMFTGIKQLSNSTKKKESYTCHTNNINLQHIGINQLENHDDDDDLPATQPVSSILLRGIVAYVEIRSGKEYRSAGTKAELESLGAKVENNFTKKVTHCFFHGGKMSTYRRATEWKVPLVSTLWIEACKAELRVLPVEGFEPHGIEKYKEELPLYRLKTKIRRPMTDSKVPAKPWKPTNLSDKAIQVAASNREPYSVSNVENNKLIEALHSVAGDIKKASNQFEEILTSPILQKASKLQNDRVKNNSKDRSLEKDVGNNKKHSKKLIFSGLNEDEQTKTCGTNSSINRVSNDLDNEIRVSYDSDDMLVYAKKQAANTRCSAPPRLLTSKKCKKLLSSCNKQPPTGKSKNNNSEITAVSNLTENKQASNSASTKRLSKTQQSPKQKLNNNKTDKRDKVSENRPKSKKRKLLLPSQTIAGFKQDSRESTPDVSNECPYKVTPNKKQKMKTTVSSKSKIAKPVVLAPPISTGWESDDSLTRAARRESSALFVKKQKHNNLQRSIPTIVCTSLHRSDVNVVASIVSTLGKFVVEGSVTERTTHVVTSSPRRTINLLKGIARGCWILNIKWIYESLESGKWLHEERFELLEFSPSVRLARVERQAFGPEFSLELFQNMGPIYVCRATVPPANDLIELIRLCGGTVVSSAKAAKIIIGSSVPFSPIGHHPLMVKEKWILDCISQLCQLNPRNYISIVPEP